MHNTFDAFEGVADLLLRDGYYAKVLGDYIGRGMTEPTFALVTKAPAVLVGYRFGEYLMDTENLPTREDTLGRNKVFY